MPSIDLGDCEQIIEQHLPSFDNNKSLFIRTCIKEYDNRQQTQKKNNNYSVVFQLFMFLLLGTGLLTFVTSIYLTTIGVFILVTPILLGAAGFLLIIYALSIIKEYRFNTRRGDELSN